MTMPVLNSQAHLEKDQARAAAGRFCVLVSSSDRARDIFEIVFQNSEKMWRDCDWPRYVGFTSKHPDLYGFTALAAKRPSNWHGELGDQLDSLPEEIQYVMLTFEDALFMTPVDGAALNAIADVMVKENLSYISLIPLARNLPGRIVEYFRRKMSTHPLRPISFSEPYYSSVCAVIWKRSYLRSLLLMPGNIWDFEHIVTKERHYAVWKAAVDQDQIVTRGKWDHQARRRLAEQGLSLENSKRAHRTYASYLRDMREKIVFQAIGFLSFRIRRRLNRISHRLDE